MDLDNFKIVTDSINFKKELLDAMQTNEWPVTFSMGMVTFRGYPLI